MLVSPTKISESPWTLPLASLMLVGMLVAFYAVVSNAAQAGELRRQSTATQSAAMVRCLGLSAREASKACRTQLNASLSADESFLVATR